MHIIIIQCRAVPPWRIPVLFSTPHTTFVFVWVAGERPTMGAWPSNGPSSTVAWPFPLSSYPLTPITISILGVRILPELACRCSNSGYSGVPAVTPEFRSLYCDRQTGLCGRSGLPGSGPVCSQLNLKYKLLSFIVKVQVAKNGCFSRPPSSDFRWMHHMFAASKSSGSMLMFIQ